MNSCQANRNLNGTIAQVLEFGRKFLAPRPEAYKEALLLLQHASGEQKEYLMAHPEQFLPDKLIQQYRQFLQRSNQGEPLAYITGYKEFWSLTIRVRPGVLIPRPETELLVEAALDLLPPNVPAKVLDLGTGSGCIALAIATERPTTSIVASDNSDICLQTAKQNAAALQLENISFIKSDWFTLINPVKFDLIIANPPYIAHNDPHLHEQVRAYEPESSLVTSQNGLNELQKIIRQGHTFLNQNGSLILEHGWRQAPAVCKQLQECGYIRVNTKQDLQGYDRVTLGVCPSPAAA